ncbi:hypothetical protein N7523_003340 [Penicillium sp. IBT 18751x]|nr:hypothetical protein N7523_003340 [Penicillium sp. IBT 18751x]
MPKNNWKEELRKFFRGEPADSTDQDDQKLYTLCQKVMNEQKSKLAAIPISSLELGEVQVMLGLELTLEDPELAAVTAVPMSPELNKIQKATWRGHSNEAIIRITLDALIVHALDTVSSSHSTSSRPLCLEAERQWGYGPVERKKGRHRLVGKSDYAVWYGEIEETELKVVVVEAKKRDYVSPSLPQCLAYMGKYLICSTMIEINLLPGIVHNLRKEAGKKDCSVYGVVSDDRHFCFLKINDNSKWSERFLRTRSRDYSEVMGLLVHLFQKGAMISPTHSKESSRKTHINEKSGSTVYWSRW